MANPTLTTEASSAVLLGGPVYDTATLSGGNAPTGTITFRLYGPSNATCGGPAAFTPGQSVVITGGGVAGPITVQSGGALQLVNTKVANGIVATNPSFLSLCDSQIAAPSGNPAQGVVVSGASTPLRIGDPARGCAGNRIAGDVRLTANTGGLTLGGNTVSGNVTVENNTVGTPVVKANSVFRTVGCAGNNPAPVNNGQVNTAPTKTGQCAGL